MCATIEVRPHPSKRRALHAIQSFLPGQIIHVFSNPLILHPTLLHLDSFCTHCLRPNNPRACSRCHAAYYCDATCQQAAWTAVHSKECKALRSKKSAAELPTPVRALLQALLKKEIEEGLEGLEGHVESKRRGKGGADLEMMAMAACAFAGKAKEEHMKRAMELLCKIETNAFHRYDADLADQVGIFLEPTLAMANHSCIPNAMVLFMGRKAVLRAETAIQAGDEIEISYTDYTGPFMGRQQALSSYSFICRCPRCIENLNVYQVCSQSRDIHLNKNWSVIGSNASKLQQHPGATDPKKIQLAMEFCSEADPDMTGLSPEARGVLKVFLDGYKPLTENDLWAVTPLPQILTEVSLYYTHKQNYTYAVVVSAFVAVECDPYRHVAPFQVVRLKNLLMVVKLMVLTAENSAALRQSLRGMASKAGLDAKIHETLADIDQVSLSQMLLIMVLKLGPEGHMDEWELGETAKELHDDILELEGREREMSLINAWREDPESDTSRNFFEYAVVQQMSALASLGRAVLKMDWEV
ncbi:hypothetical protein QQS21_003960 [Conoideocrella luteorostrata]|uniref:MYND-type zinc finger protein samB n=1 Tax=Conoideocrella luteorostrata TaxID=1105319 RepID=A0AAJ0G067_9HYPO|nr:hypothetical protein QQS21_003960 [Conoideocrella luteorostrata]